MATNDFKPFAIGAGANVVTQAEWQTLPALSAGFTSGKASSAQFNKGLRQSSSMAAAVGQFIADATGLDVKDDGDVAGLSAKLKDAVGKSAAGRLIAVRTITTSGTYTPTPGTKSIIVEVQGAGGGGGGANSTSGQSGAGCGGQSGTYIKHMITTVSASYACVIGSGGSGGVGANPGNAGGSTTIAGLTAPGGGAGGTTSGTGVNLAFIVTPAVNPTGGSIENAGASSGDGAVVFNASVSKSGIGGSSSMGSGGGQRGTPGAGVNASGYGAGGSGANSPAATGAFTGGNGSSGCIIVWEYS